MATPFTAGILGDRNSLVRRLGDAGLSKEGADTRAGMAIRLADRLKDAGCHPEAPVHTFWVPGRIEVLGKHTDYAGGRSLLAATERGFCFAFSPRPDRVMRIWQEKGPPASFEIDRDLAPSVGHWTNYPMTVARRLARNFPDPLCGADIAFASDLPGASGMSSSSAIVVGFFLGLSAVNALAETDVYRSQIRVPEELGEYLGTVENGQSYGILEGDKGVGTFGGSEDHTAMLCCKRGRFSQYAYCPVRFEAELVIPEGFTFAVGVSGVTAEKTGGAMELFNRASHLASEAARIWRESSGHKDPHLAAAITRCNGDPDSIRYALRNCKGISAEDLLDRFEHFYRENEQILPGAVRALEQGDLEGFGSLVDQSQDLGARLLKNQVPETEFLAREARRLGAVAASAFGAGFGGSVWALVQEEDAEDFLGAWDSVYGQAYSEHANDASFFCTPAGPAAFEF